MLAERIVATIKAALARNDAVIALHEPTFAGREWEYVKDCLDNGWVSSAGSYVERFEARLAEQVGVRCAVAVTNGTAALHVALLLAGVGHGDEVLVPALTFVATANAVVYCGATPHFVDSEERSLGLDPGKLAAYLETVAEMRAGGCYNRRSGRRIAAVIPMHAFGHPVDLEPLLELSRRYHIPVVEDAAQALGSLYRGRPVGGWGKLAALSFNGNKIITCGGGGAILTDDEDLGRRARHLTTTAKIPHRWELAHDMLGYNYRMPNLNAALGCAQLEQLPRLLQQKRRLAEAYRAAFAQFEGVRFAGEPPYARSNFWLNTVLLDDASGTGRDCLLELAHAAGILCRPAWALLQRLPMYAHAPRMDLSVAENVSRRVICLPSSPFLGDMRD